MRGIIRYAAAVLVLSIQVLWAQEMQVPLDSAGTLQQIDANLERELGLFPAFAGFQEARLFLLPDSSYALEVRFGNPPHVLRERVPMSDLETAAFRQTVTERLRRERPAALLDRSGQTRFLIGTSVLAVGFYSWAAAVVINKDDSEVAATTGLISTGLGIALPVLAIQHSSISEAEARLALYGGTRGIVHGIFGQRLITGNDDGDAAVAGGFICSVGELIGGYHLASAYNLQAGDAATIGVLGDFGLGIGICAAGLADYYESGDYRRQAAATILAGSAAGLATGALLTRGQSYTVGDAAVLRETGLLGALIPLTIVDISRSRESDAYLAAAMAGSVAGLAAGHLLTRDTDLSATQGLQITLATAAGALIGMGIGDIAARQSPGDDNSVPYLVGASLGGTLGFGLSFGSIYDKQRMSKQSSWNVSVAPEGIAHLIAGPEWRTDAPAPPLLRASVRF